MIINHNISAMNTLNALGKNNAATSKSLQKLSTGYRINGASDDAAGLAISEKMRGQISGLKQSAANAQDGISMLQTAEGGLDQTHSILQRMRELSVQSANDTNTSDDRQKIQGEVDQLAKEISRISNTTEFNTQNLLAGGLSDTFHIGANAGQNLSVSVSAMDAQSLGVAGSNVAASSVADNAKLNISSASRGLAAGTGYKVKVTTVTAKLTQSVNTTVAQKIGGSFSVSSASTYTGTADLTYAVKVASVSNTTGASSLVKSISYSTDGGTSWKTVTSNNFKTGVQIDGMTFKFGGGTVAAGTGFTAGDTYTFSVRASAKTLQFSNKNAAVTGTGNTNLGASVTVHVGDTSASVGDAANNQTVGLSFDYSKLTAGSITFKTVVTDSKSAVLNGGVVATNATVEAGISVATQKDANSAITAIDKAINAVSKQRSQLGAYQNRLTNTIDNLNTSNENITSAESRIRDVDMSSEMMNYQKNNILQQAANAMLAKANQQPQSVLQLLQG